MIVAGRKCSGRWHLNPAPFGPLLCGLPEDHEGFHGAWEEVGEYLGPGLGPGMFPREPSEEELREAEVKRKVRERKLEGVNGQMNLEVFVDG